MKAPLIALALVFSMSAFAKTKVDKCSIFIAEPKITHDQYGTNTNQNTVNIGVTKLLMNNGFKVSKDQVSSRYTLYTEVRCGKMWTFFGLQDSCQTAIEIYDYTEEKVAYTDGPTVAKPGLNIDFNSINFPKCSDL